MRDITDIVIHEADTPTGKPFTVEDIDQWHRDRGFQRDASSRVNFNFNLKAIGYHYVIYIDGSIHTGRSEDEVGAHVQGHNAHSIGICLIGKGVYTHEQWEALASLVTTLLQKYPQATVHGHCEYDTAIAQGKTCPDFDVQAWNASNFMPLA